MDHFQGKEPLEHIIEARKKGAFASEEIHGRALANHLTLFCDAIKESSLIMLLLFFLLSHLSYHPFPLIYLFMAGYLVWRVGRSTLFGYRKLERLHRLIEEERWEITHNREDEKKELKSLYAAKGFSGKMLDDVVDILMADDNRLLQEMLEEEMGLALESMTHPLKQGFGTLFGVLLSIIIMIPSLLFMPYVAAFGVGVLLTMLSSIYSAKKERNHVFKALSWNVALFILSYLCIYFLTSMVHP